jgi:hypothetical protein
MTGKWIKELVFWAIDTNDNVVSWCQRYSE